MPPPLGLENKAPRARESDPRGPQVGPPEDTKIGSRGPRSTDFSGQPPKDFLVQKTSRFFWPIVRPSYLDPLVGPKNLVHFPSPEILGSLARGGQRPKDLLVQKMALAGSIFVPLRGRVWDHFGAPVCPLLGSARVGGLECI